MPRNQPSKPRFFNLMHYTWTLLTVWTLIVMALLAKEFAGLNQYTHETALNTARAHLNKDKSFRFWGSMHGGIYVPVNADTPPNPYLEGFPERDVYTPSGRHLTLMNPEYMVRNMNETYSELYGFSGHITSLKPLRPENGPDAWERKALLAFEDGADEVIEITKDENGDPVIRLMEPLYVSPQCMSCHGHQGYKLGDIRGGVGIALPMKQFINHSQKQLLLHTISLVVLWLLGCVVITIGSERLRKRTAELAVSNIDLHREIEERSKAEQALKKETTFVSAILDTAGALVMVLDTEGRIIRFNKTCEMLTGYEFKEVSGKPFWDILLDDTESRLTKKQFADLGQSLPKKFEKPLISKTGKRHVIDWANTTFVGDDGAIEYFISIGIDITEEKQLQEQLLHAEKLSAVGKLSASIAHEINNPLFGIRNVLARIKEKAKLDTENGEFIDLAVDECDRIKNLIKDLQDFNRPTTGEMTPMDLHMAIENMLLLSKKELEKKKISVKKQFTRDLGEIIAIADQMKQVFLNLINNAIEAIKDNGEIVVTTEKRGNQAIIMIADNGAGINSDDLKHIFEPFFTTKSSVKGTGLGLSVTYGIIKRHGGDIIVTSEKGKGTTFTISLPIGASL